MNVQYPFSHLAFWRRSQTPPAGQEDNKTQGTPRSLHKTTPTLIPRTNNNCTIIKAIVEVEEGMSEAEVVEEEAIAEGETIDPIQRDIDRTWNATTVQFHTTRMMNAEHGNDMKQN